jgi:hypothetical protein
MAVKLLKTYLYCCLRSTSDPYDDHRLDSSKSLDKGEEPATKATQ